MQDLADFKAPFIRLDEIWGEADVFLDAYWSPPNLPVDILSIVEFDLPLEIDVVAGLREIADVDALLLGDMKTIIVDKKDFMAKHAQNRLRYSVAHEVGHYVLHKEVVQDLGWRSVDEWIDTIDAIPEDQYTWLEQHAYEFAGRILVPRDELVRAFNGAIDLAEEKGFSDWDATGDASLQYVAQGVSREFRVSGDVIERRLKREKLWPPNRREETT